MTTVLNDTPTSRCQFYRRVCALPAVVRPDTDTIVFRAGPVGAITMPAILGSQVRLHLRRRNLGGGPIISHPRSKRWTFLVCPDIPDEVPLFCELFRVNVTVASRGAEIALPAPTIAGAAFRLWVDEPTHPFRPPGMAVVESVRACAATGSGRHG
ncbi:DNA-directed RNA polymerase subunit beta [Nocardia farcinica]|uniref:DNA-directed RNA polymerase subunit beta n=1 Tax=Nocardia farcinica TaxID=37329 RepID=UPI0018951EF5|nr:DNA-directed RNA polymerase subunit beta [Nocardia farcinica]MBF6519686.1 DNA-directed RNA polymerase subunit beta [Nocardia farcinica]